VKKTWAKLHISTKAKRWALGVLFAILMAEVLIIAPKEIGVSSRTDSPLLSHSDTSDGTQQSMRGVHLIEAKGEQRDWELWSDQAFTTKSGSLWRLENVKVKFFGEQNLSYLVTGKTGEVEVNTKDIRIAGNVTMTSSNGYTFKTDHLDYKSGTRIISTNDPVAMTGGEKKIDTELTGVGITANMLTNDIVVEQAVRSKRKLESGEYVYIESEKAEFSSAHKFAKYVGDVTIDFKGSRITGPSARFDYDPQAKNVGSMMIEGGGRITDLTKWATAKTIQMLFKENKFILKGAPRVVQDNDELVGEEIVFLDGGKEIVVNRAKAKFTPKGDE
jgi:LPS export ABC transporter protein LptC